MMETDVIALLVGSSAIQAEVGTRIYPGSLPQGGVLPALVFNVISGAPIYSDEGEVGLDRWRIQIDGYAESYTGTKALQDAVRGVLSGYANDGTVPFAELDAVRDLRDAGSGEVAYPFRVSMDFIILARS